MAPQMAPHADPAACLPGDGAAASPQLDADDAALRPDHPPRIARVERDGPELLVRERGPGLAPVAREVRAARPDRHDRRRVRAGGPRRAVGGAGEAERAGRAPAPPTVVRDRYVHGPLATAAEVAADHDPVQRVAEHDREDA